MIIDHRFFNTWITIIFLLVITNSQATTPSFFSNQTISTDQKPLILNLETAINLALNYNNMLKNIGDDVLTAELNEELSLTQFDFQMIPQANTGYVEGGSESTGYTIGTGIEINKKTTIGTLISVCPSVYKTGSKFHTNLQATIVQPLFRGFGKTYNLAEIRSAEFRFRSASRALLKASNTIIMRTIELLYEVEKQSQLVKVNQESYEYLKKLSAGNKLKEKLGIADELDIFRSQIDFKQSEDTLEESNERLQELKDQLRDILSLPMSTNILVDIPLEHTEVDWDLNQAINISLDNRIEFEQAADQYAECRRLAKFAKLNECMPELNLILDYSSTGWGDGFYDTFGERRNSRFSVGLNTTKNLDFTGDANACRLAVKAVEIAERANYEIKNNIILEVKRSIRMLNRAREKIILQKQQIKTATGELKLSQLKYLRGYSDNCNVLQAEKTLRTAQTDLITAVIEHIIGEYRVNYALGLLIKKNDMVQM